MSQDGTGAIDFEEFLNMMTAKMSDKDTREDIMKVFNLFDDDQSGTISLRNLKRVAKELGETMSGTLVCKKPAVAGAFLYVLLATESQMTRVSRAFQQPWSWFCSRGVLRTLHGGGRSYSPRPAFWLSSVRAKGAAWPCSCRRAPIRVSNVPVVIHLDSAFAQMRSCWK